jgi:hypothetical protein
VFPTRAAITYSTVALSGEVGANLGYGPHIEPNSQFTDFSPPVINASGQVAFAADTGTPGSYSGIWTNIGGSPIAVARVGAVSPGPNLGSGINFTTFEALQSLNVPLLTDDGKTVFIGKLNGSGINTSNDHGVWSSSGGTSTVIAREGAHPGPGLGTGVVFAGAVNSPFAASGRVPAANGAGHLAYVATLLGPGIDSSNSYGIWTSSAGSMTLVARAGSQGPGPNVGNGVYFNGFSEPAMNSSGALAFAANLTGSVDYLSREGIWVNTPGSLNAIARTGIAGPGPNLESGVNFTKLEIPVINDSGAVAFRGKVGGGDYNEGNASGIWTNLGGTLTRVVQQGTMEMGPNLGAGITFLSLDDPVLNSAGDIAFVGSVKGPGVSDGNRNGIWMRSRDGAMNLIVREGITGMVPGFGNEVSFGLFHSTIISPYLNASGEVAFVASAVGTETGSHYGIWAWSKGELLKIALAGDPFDVNPDPSVDDIRTISGISAAGWIGMVYYNGSGGDDGRPTMLNDDGLVAFALTFSDGTSGIFTAQLPRQPGDFDNDGDVDGADFVAWQTNFPLASGATLAMGDADRDGDVDGADFVVWQTNFSTSPGGAASPVPEPASGLLAFLSATTLFLARRSR